MKRKRIVIDLSPKEKAAAAVAASNTHVITAEPRRGIGRPLMIIAIVLLALIGGVVGGAYYWWKHFQSSPAYTLAVLADAAQRNDNPTIDSIFDTDKVTDDFIAQIKQKTPSSPVKSPLPFKLSPSVPEMTPQLRQTAHDELIKELQRLTRAAAGKPVFLLAIGVKYLADIKEENNVAHAVVNIRDEELRLTMQSDSGHWRIVAVQDDKLVKRIADAVMRDMPPGVQLEDAIRKQLEKLGGK